MHANCEICGKLKKKWYSLGGKETIACSDISCGKCIKPVITTVKKVVKKSRIKTL